MFARVHACGWVGGCVCVYKHRNVMCMLAIETGEIKDQNQMNNFSLQLKPHMVNIVNAYQ